MGIIHNENQQLYLYVNLRQIQEAILILDNVGLLGKLPMPFEISSIIRESQLQAQEKMAAYQLD